MTIENSHAGNITSILNNYKSKVVSADEAVKCI